MSDMLKAESKHQDFRFFLARVSAVNGLQGACKTVSATLDADPREPKLRRAVLIGIEARRKAHGIIVRDKEGVRAHIFYDAGALRRLPAGASVRVDWVPVGNQLMTNIALTITDPDCDKGESPED